jgi:ABC-2 type transport system ATP-binding protein/ABC-2 type transport system permease protein
MLCGILIPRHEMLPALDAISVVLPMTYVVDAMARLTTSPGLDRWLLRDILIVAGCTAASLALAAVTLQRRHP